MSLHRYLKPVNKLPTADQAGLPAYLNQAVTSTLEQDEASPSKGDKKSYLAPTTTSSLQEVPNCPGCWNMANNTTISNCNCPWIVRIAFFDISTCNYLPLQGSILVRKYDGHKQHSLRSTPWARCLDLPPSLVLSAVKHRLRALTPLCTTTTDHCQTLTVKVPYKVNDQEPNV